MRTLILASSSPYRRALLGRLGLPFECLPAGLDEQPLANERPAELVRRLAHAKARAVAQPDAVVIGSDQVAVLGGTAILGKPGSHDKATEQLRGLRRQVVRFLTAVVVVDGPGGTCHEHLDETTVTFKNLSDAEIEAYLVREQPYDCAGAFKAEGLGIALFDRIESHDPTALIGLPLIWLSSALARVGLNPLTASALRCG